MPVNMLVLLGVVPTRDGSRLGPVVGVLPVLALHHLPLALQVSSLVEQSTRLLSSHGVILCRLCPGTPVVLCHRGARASRWL